MRGSGRAQCPPRGSSSAGAVHARGARFRRRRVLERADDALAHEGELERVLGRLEHTRAPGLVSWHAGVGMWQGARGVRGCLWAKAARRAWGSCVVSLAGGMGEAVCASCIYRYTTIGRSHPIFCRLLTYNVPAGRRSCPPEMIVKGKVGAAKQRARRRGADQPPSPQDARSSRAKVRHELRASAEMVGLRHGSNRVDS